ncbi:hypothetical protein QJQ45_018682, partial [Haematococcus lacustris]
PVSSALLTSLLFMPAQVLAPLQGKQREERRAEWKTQRRQVRTPGPALFVSLHCVPACQSADCAWPQVIKVPGGAVLRGCKKTKRKLMAHFQLRAGVHSQLRVIASLYVLRIFLTCLVGYSTPGFRSALHLQPCSLLPASMAMDWEPQPDPDPEPDPEPEPAPAPPTLRRPSARLAARHPPAAAPTGPPMPLDSEDPVMLQQLQVFFDYFANSSKLKPYNQLQRRLGRPRQILHYSIKPAFDDPSNQELLAKLQQLGSVNLTGDNNTISHHSMQLAVAMQQHYSNPGNLDADSPELQAATLDKGHVADLIEEAAKCLEQWQQPPTPPVPGKPKSGRPAGPSSSNSSPVAAPGAAAVAAHELGLPRIGKGLAETRQFVFNPATQIGVGIDPGVTQAVSATSGVWDPATGQLMADQLRRWKLTKGQVRHGSGLNNARRDTEWWLAPIKPHLQHLAAASSTGTSLEANLKHITVTLATWDAVWEVYLDPKWAQQRLRLYGA